MARKPQASRKWRIHIIRRQAQYLGSVEAADADAAIKTRAIRRGRSGSAAADGAADRAMPRRRISPTCPP